MVLQGSDYALRYHDLHANRFLRYFRGHTGRVTTLAMSPRSDVFLSAAEDKQASYGGRGHGLHAWVCSCSREPPPAWPCAPSLTCVLAGSRGGAGKSRGS